jgi:hypothetical protein
MKVSKRMKIVTVPVVGNEPSADAVNQYMAEHQESYYNARERLREIAYGGKPPGGFQCWGDYWKAY